MRSGMRDDGFGALSDGYGLRDITEVKSEPLTGQSMSSTH